MSFIDNLRAATRRRNPARARALPAPAEEALPADRPEPVAAASAEVRAPPCAAQRSPEPVSEPVSVSEPGDVAPPRVPEAPPPPPALLPVPLSARWLVDASKPPSAVARLAPPPSRRPWKRVVALLALVLLAGAGVALSVYLTRDDSDNPSGENRPTQRAGAALRVVRGIPQVGAWLGTDKEVPTLTLYVDIASREFARLDRDVIPALISDYVRPGRLKIRLRMLPRDAGVARAATRYAQAAGLQTKLWEYVRSLESLTGGKVGRRDLDDAALVAGINLQRLVDDSRSARIERAIARDARLASEQHIEETPAFTLFDGATTRDLPASVSARGFAKALDRALSEPDSRRGT